MSDLLCTPLTEATLRECEYAVLLELFGDDGVEEGVGARIEWIEYNEDNLGDVEAAVVGEERLL